MVYKCNLLLVNDFSDEMARAQRICGSVNLFDKLESGFKLRTRKIYENSLFFVQRIYMRHTHQWY